MRIDSLSLSAVLTKEFLMALFPMVISRSIRGWVIKGWQSDLYYFRPPLKNLHRRRPILTKRVYYCSISFSAPHNWRALNDNWHAAPFIRPYHWACCLLSVSHDSLPRYVGRSIEERTANFWSPSAVIHDGFCRCLSRMCNCFLFRMCQRICVTNNYTILKYSVVAPLTANETKDNQKANCYTG